MRTLQLLTLLATASTVSSNAATKSGAMPLLLRRAITSVVREPITTIRWNTRLLREGQRPMRVGVDVEIRETGDVRGRGLYALRTLEEEELVGRYTGKVVLKDEWETYDSDGLYAMGMANGDVVCGADEKSSSFPRFINHSVRNKPPTRIRAQHCCCATASCLLRPTTTQRKRILA